ncbi:MAG: PTS sugar transporter subunit IIA [Lentisphaeria bacterium]|nr:PTS sugar transporter subunit IIA [Lentisphaeria bacterium]
MPYTLMSLEDAAEFLRLDVSDVRSLAVQGEIPHEVQGERLLFRQGQLKVWASQRVLQLRGKHLQQYHSRGILHPHDLSRNAPIVRELTEVEFHEPRLEGRSKTAVLRSMTALAERTGYLYDPDDLYEELRQREELCSTGTEGGVALLHPRYHDPFMVEDSFLCAGRTLVPIPFGAPDGGLTDVFFLLCCQDDRIHLHVLSRLCLLCHSTSMLAAIRAATTAREMYEALQAAEDTFLRLNR